MRNDARKSRIACLYDESLDAFAGEDALEQSDGVVKARFFGTALAATIRA